MIGITSYGAYIPPTRLALGAIGGRTPKEGGPEKAVAWNDEDSVTMGVTAAVNCLRGFDRAYVDSVLFASTTYPFREKQGAALVAAAARRSWTGLRARSHRTPRDNTPCLRLGEKPASQLNTGIRRNASSGSKSPRCIEFH